MCHIKYLAFVFLKFESVFWLMSLLCMHLFQLHIHLCLFLPHYLVFNIVFFPVFTVSFIIPFFSSSWLLKIISANNFFSKSLFYWAANFLFWKPSIFLHSLFNRYFLNFENVISLSRDLLFLPRSWLLVYSLLCVKEFVFSLVDFEIFLYIFDILQFYYDEPGKDLEFFVLSHFLFFFFNDFF